MDYKAHIEPVEAELDLTVLQVAGKYEAVIARILNSRKRTFYFDKESKEINVSVNVTLVR